MYLSGRSKSELCPDVHLNREDKEMAEEYAVRRYEDGDEIQITDVMNEVFSQSRTPEQWLWKNKENPSGFDKDAIVLGVRGEQIISHVGGLLSRTKVRDGQEMGLLTFDFAVRADFRRGLKKAGTFLRTARVAEAYYTEAYDFTYGFPNPEHLRMGKRFLKYETAGEIPRLTKRLSLRPFAARFVKARWLLCIIHGMTNAGFRVKHLIFDPRGARQISVVPVTSFDERADDLWERASRSFPIAIVRDRAYLNWRYCRPGQVYHVWAAFEGDALRGYMSYRTLKYGQVRAGVIMDLLPADDIEVGVALCRAAIDQAVRDRVDFVECWMLDQYPFCSVLERFGFRAKPSQDILTFRVLKGKTPTEFFLDLKNWYITLCDTDEL